MINSKLTLFSESVPSGEITNNDIIPADAAQEESITDKVISDTTGADSDTGAETTPDAAESQSQTKTRREIYDEFIRSHKDLFAEDTQKIINRRFKETKEVKAKLALADEKIKELETRLEYKEPCPPGDDFLLSHPDFSIERELENETFRILYNSGIDCAVAYNAAHADELIDAAKSGARREAVKATLDNVRARGVRISESAQASLPGFSIKRDVSRLSRNERADIARRVMAGEKISFT